MNTMLGTSKRIEVARAALLASSKKFFSNQDTTNPNETTRVPLWVNFFDDESAIQKCTSQLEVEQFINDYSQPGGDTGFYLAFKDILSAIKENKYTSVYIYLLSDGQDSYPQDTIEEVASLEDYLKENGIFSRFSTIGISQPDTQLMSKIINFGTQGGNYVYVDEDLESTQQIKVVNSFFNLINQEVFKHPKGISMTVLGESIFVPVSKENDTLA